MSYVVLINEKKRYFLQFKKDEDNNKEERTFRDISEAFEDLNSDLEEYGKDYKFISEQGADIQESKTLSFHQLTSGCNLYIIMKKEDGTWGEKNETTY